MASRMIVRPKSSLIIPFLGFVFASSIMQAPAATSSLDNGTVRITVDLAQGGGIVAFHPTGQTSNSTINTYDRGRNCQQSYYSGPSQFLPAGTTQNPKWNPWPWNPVQGGDCYNNGSGTMSWSNDGTTLYVKSRPKQWALQNYDADCIFEQWITLNGSVATVQNRLINGRSDTTQYEAMDQELGALYTWSKLTELWTYKGTQPFTGGALTQIPKTAPPWAYFRATEGWAAYTASSGSKLGVGILVRGNCSFIGGFAGTLNSGTQSSANTGYIAPLRREVIDHNIVHDFTYQLILGNLADIRNYAVSQQANLKPNFFFRGTRAGWTYQVASDSGYPIPADHLRVNVNTGDPQMWGPECSFQAAEVPKLYIRAAYHCATDSTKTAELFWERENGTSPVSGTQRQPFTATNDGQLRMYTVDLSTNANWTGQISRLRFDPVPSGSADDYVEVLGITSTAPGVAISQSGGSTAVTEGGATDTYTVVLTGEPTANVTITPTPGSQLTVSPASLTFTTSNWNVPQTLTVTAIDDAIAQGTRIQTITNAASSADPGYNGIAIAAVTATITDNDTAGVNITESGSSTAVTEGGATDTYTAVLTSEPTGNVTITPAPGSQLTVSPASLTFTTSNWNVPQTLTVTAIDDAIAQGTRIQTITNAASSADPGYNGIGIAIVNVTITDNVSSFNEWTGGGVPITPQLLEKYAVGGALNPAGSSEQAVSRISGSNFTLTAIARINDPFLTVVGQTSTDLITWSNLVNNPSGTPSSNQAGAPSGCKRLDFTTPVAADLRKFLRLKITNSSP